VSKLTITNFNTDKMKRKRRETGVTISDEVRQQALEQFKSGKPLFGKGGAFAPMLQELLEAALEGELSAHLDDEEEEDSNRRNGHSSKQIKSSVGSFELSTPRDRNGSFSPEIVKKRQTILADSLEDRIIGMYGLGMSTRDISKHIEETYGTEVSHTVISEVTDRIIPKVREWQSRPLEAVYAMVWLDAMFYKVKDEQGHVVTRCVYNVLGIRTDGHKEVLGCYVSESEGAKFWLSVLSDLHDRGIEDILIASIDNLNGFDQAIATVFPHTEIQTCIVHQVRNTMKYVASKDSKAVMADVKKVYQAASKEVAEEQLNELEKKWDKKYPAVIKSWRNNWHKLSTFFKYPAAIRKLVYTTNTIEGYHRQIRKVTKTKGAFPSDMALLKLIYLASERIEEKWSMPLANWGITAQQLSIIFGGRMKLTL
jgi:putative transposase